MRPSSFIPYRQGPLQTRNAKGVTDFLRLHDKMASLLPVATRLGALQKDCAAALPAMFEACAVLSCESDRLVLAVPNSAMAGKLKQQLPKLLDRLRSRGWQVIAIRLKVQVIQEIAKIETTKQLALPPIAISALSSLDSALDDSPRNKGIKAVLGAMLRRHQA